MKKSKEFETIVEYFFQHNYFFWKDNEQAGFYRTKWVIRLWMKSEMTIME
jgi:hypothetical protein